MGIKGYLNDLLKEDLKESGLVTVGDISDNALVLLSAIDDGNKFFIRLNSKSEAMEELENFGYVKNKKMTKEGKQYFKTRQAMARLAKIGE